MVDFQYGGLEPQVFELIAKMCELCSPDDFPHFKTIKVVDDLWRCSLSIPGVEKEVATLGETEAKAINKCASTMLFILEQEHNKKQYDPEEENSVFLAHIEQFFGNVNYDSDYNYHLYETDVMLDERYPEIYSVLKDYASRSINEIKRNGEEIDQMSNNVTIRFLVKKKKNNRC